MQPLNKNIIFITFLSLLSVSIKSQNKIVCDSLNITLSDIEVNVNTIKDSTFLFKKQLHIDAYLSILNANKKDIITFNVMPLLPVADFSVRNLNVRAMLSSKKTAQIKNKIINANQFVVSNIKNNISKIHISYDIIGVYMFSPTLHFDSIVNKMYFYLSDIESLILCNEKMEFTNIKFINMDKNIIAFPFFDIDNKTNKLTRYSIIAVDTTLCPHYSQQLNKLKYSIFTIDSVNIFLFNKIKDIYENTLNKISETYPPQITAFSIISSFWRNTDKKNSYGKAFGNYYFCDIAFLSDPHSLIHETIHLLYPQIVQENTNGSFFIKETLVEWLSQYLIYGKVLPNGNQITINKNQCLFDVRENDENSWNIIYFLGTVLLEKFAKETSYDKLFNSIMKFFTAKNNFDITYNDFINFLLKENYSEKIVKDLELLIKGNYQYLDKNFLLYYNIEIVE
ncbi:MAG: hypothetical protein LBB53_05680 [Prevotellaceae bacterium]|jgi:hypothetical protein|nr:hypothetical protein [Prevotellaceae bacterium]